MIIGRISMTLLPARRSGQSLTTTDPSAKFAGIYHPMTNLACQGTGPVRGHDTWT
jgi:hypothetical protein